MHKIPLCWLTQISLSSCFRVRVIVFNSTWNTFSVISLRSGLLVEQTGVPGESHRPAYDKLYLIEYILH